MGLENENTDTGQTNPLTSQTQEGTQQQTQDTTNPLDSINIGGGIGSSTSYNYKTPDGKTGNYIDDLILNRHDALSKSDYFPGDSNVIKGYAFGMPLIAPTVLYPFALTDAMLYQKAKEKQQKAMLVNKLSAIDFANTIDENKNVKLQEGQMKTYSKMQQKYIDKNNGDVYKGLVEMNASNEYRETHNLFKTAKIRLDGAFNTAQRILNPPPSEKGNYYTPATKKLAEEYSNSLEGYDGTQESLEKVLKIVAQMQKSFDLDKESGTIAKAINNDVVSNIDKRFGSTQSNLVYGLMSIKGNALSKEDIDKSNVPTPVKDELKRSYDENERKMEAMYSTLTGLRKNNDTGKWEGRGDGTFAWSFDDYKNAVMSQVSEQVKENVHNVSSQYWQGREAAEKLNKGWYFPSDTTVSYVSNGKQETGRMWDLSGTEDKKKITAEITPDNIVGSYNVVGGAAQIGKAETSTLPKTGKYYVNAVISDDKGQTYAVVSLPESKIKVSSKGKEGETTSMDITTPSQRYLVPLNKVWSAVKTQIGVDEKGHVKLSDFDESGFMPRRSNAPYQHPAGTTTHKGSDLN